MSAKEHDNTHDQASGDNTASHPQAPTGPLPATPQHGFWKSLRELDGKAPWQLEPHIKEFEPGTEPTATPLLDPMSRRNFFNLMGASLGLAGIAGATGCRYDKEEIVPLSRRPDGHVPGQVLQYATTFELGGSAHAVVATSFEGRPIKIDGNPDHPFAGGAIVAGTKRHAGAHTFAQAAILHLYDPDRSQSVLNSNKGSSFDAFKASLGDIKKALTQNARVLSEATSSPTVLALRRRLEQGGVGWHEYEPLSWDNERLGMKAAFGRSVRPIARLDRAETIVTIDCDIFVEHPAAMKYNRDFARSRRKDGSLGVGKMNRLWVAESVMSNTGAMADHRLGMRAELGLPFAMALDAAVSGGGAPNSEFLKETKVAQFITILAEELKVNAGRAVVIAGRRQPAEVHALVAKINQAIGAPGATLDYVEDPDPERPSHLQSITALAQDIQGGRVSTLIILGGNPAYDAPADLDFARLLGDLTKKPGGVVVHLGEYADETSQLATWHLPKAHFLEAWGDARTWDGTVSVAQPLINPMWGGISSAELLSMLLGDELPSEQLVKATVGGMAGGANWKQVVHDGFVPGSNLATAGVQFQALPAFNLTPSQQAGSRRKNGELEVVYHYSSFTYDGRFSNNPWLWETPDFLTKVTWDNYALVSPETAVSLGLENNHHMKVTVDGRSITLPCYVMPGQAKSSIGLVLGGGRKVAGRSVIAGGEKSAGPGYNTYVVRSSKAFDFAANASVSNTGDHYVLASVQDHWNYKPGNNKLMGYKDDAGLRFDPEVERRSREDVEETTAEELEKNRTWSAAHESEFWDDTAEAATEKSKARHLSLFEEHDYHGHRWAMAIDLTTCTGCNSCMVACQSENNVPVVGRTQVNNNREMHWIRIDRYFQGSPEEPHVVHQPLACQQCENAPCEQVCPVGATQHSDEGLNDMAYNRCIGTRYCANNCPYRVRRFNFLDWNKEWREARNKVRRLLFNPDVTVRMRGVMEKCTFCVQRIQNGKIKAKAQIRSGQRQGAVGAPLPDGEIETACQQACPTEAIVFGD
ncbi:MAG TPA: 4Fe-4S dicluster domain-containing protein, partial [Kofleriaceae bacterium]|nr:4Fe-4S dicluster domain-containing protein [Kofleriaceae bacterium]